MNSIILQNLNSNVFPSVLLLVIFFIILLLLILRKKNCKDNLSAKLDEFYSKIREEIKSAVAPKFMTVSVEANEITNLAIEIWRIEQRMAKSASSLPENERIGLESSIQKLRRYLEKYDIEIVDYKNQKYNDGLNLDVVGVEKDPSITESIIKEIKEPTIMLKGQVVRKAKIILLSNH